MTQIKNTYYLTPIYDARQSFYNKAIVSETSTKKELYSYNTLIATIKDDVVILTNSWDYSPTTLRHLKEFLKQNGFKAETKQQIEKDYTK